MFNYINQNVELPVYSTEGKEVRKLTLTNSLFGIEPQMPSVQLAVRVELANARQGTAKTKTRAEVSGGGKKPWRQKGTGRARAGSTRSPIFRHGGTVFGPTGHENHKLKINKKVYGLALCSVLSDKAMKNNILVLEVAKDKDLAEIKTKNAVKMLETMGLKKGTKTMVLVDDYIENLIMSLSNIKNIGIAHYANMSVYDILNAEKLVLTSGALEAINQLVSFVDLGEEKEMK